MRSAPASTAQSTAGDLAFHARGFELSLAAADKRPNTIESYPEAIEQLACVSFHAKSGATRSGRPSRPVMSRGH